MNASDWIAAVSALIAALAFVASRGALKLQRVQAQDTVRQEGEHGGRGGGVARPGHGAARASRPDKPAPSKTISGITSSA